MLLGQKYIYQEHIQIVITCLKNNRDHNLHPIIPNFQLINKSIQLSLPTNFGPL